MVAPSTVDVPPEHPPSSSPITYAAVVTKHPERSTAAGSLGSDRG